MGNISNPAQQTAGSSPMGGAPQPLPPVSAVRQMGEPPGAYQQMPQHQMMPGLQNQMAPGGKMGGQAQQAGMNPQSQVLNNAANAQAQSAFNNAQNQQLQAFNQRGPLGEPPGAYGANPGAQQGWNQLSSLFGGNPGAYGVPGQNFGQQGGKAGAPAQQYGQGKMGGQSPQYGQGKMGGQAPQYGGQKMGGYAPQYGAQSKLGGYAPQFGGQGKGGYGAPQGGPTPNFNQQMAAQALMGRNPPAPTMQA